jgi:methyl-accepting chemotaxis protein
MDNGASKIKQTSQAQSEAVAIIVTVVNEMFFAINEVAKNAQMTANKVKDVNRITKEGGQ